MRPRLIVMTALILVRLMRTTATAQDTDPVMLPEVEVTEDRITEAEQRAPTSFVSVVDVPSRAAPIETTADVLSESVGVQVQRFGGLGAFTTISIRGSSANQVPVYLDGIPLSQAQDQTVNLSDLPLDSLSRIDVYRGTIPVGFGGGGIGGVVNLVTRPPTDEPRTEVIAGYGSFDTRKVVATHTRRVGETGVLAHVSYLGSEGDFTYFDDNGTPENPTDDGEVTRVNNAFNAVDGLLKVTRDLGDGLAADLVQEVFYKGQGVPGLSNTQFTDTALTTARSLTYLRLRASGLADDAIDGEARVFGIYNLQAFDDPEGEFGVRSDTHNETMLVGGSAAGTWFAPLNQVVGGFTELAYEEFFPYNAYNFPLPKNGPDQTRLRFTLAAQDEIGLIADRVVVVPSLRYDHFSDQFSQADVDDEPAGPTQHSNLDLFTPSIGAQARVASWLTVRGNIGRFQRAPNFAELFGNAGSIAGNLDLEPETGINRDAGFVATWPAFRWLDAGRLEYAFFHNNISDLIAFELANPQQFKPFNIGDARIVGHEVALRAGAWEHLGLEVNYTHQESENRSVDSPEGNQLPLRPDDELFVRPSLTGPWGSLLYYEYTYISANPTDADNFVIVPSRSLHTIGCAVQPLAWLSLKFEAANITDADIRDLGYFPLPGLSFFGGVKAVF